MNGFAAVDLLDATRQARALANADAIFQKWLGGEYDLDALHAVLATAAVERMSGDPVWTLLISGPGNAKTETVQALAGTGAMVTSTIASEGALLSGTPSRDKQKDASGGLLRRLGSSGLLVIKDVTSILSMHRDTRASLLAALREVYDGRWERNLGTDGGRTLTWTGRIAVVGAVTTAWDRAHEAIAAMGDRFVTVRMDSATHAVRMAAGHRALCNIGDEERMRSALAAAVKSLVAQVDAISAVTLTDYENGILLSAANLVTVCRTAVEYDYRGELIDAHAPEVPTRFAKQLGQMLRGAVAIGLPRDAALALALRCARDSMPPLRLAILKDVEANPRTRAGDVRRRLDKPRMTVDRQLQALHMLGVLTCEEVELNERSRWYYTVADGVTTAVLSPEKSPPIGMETGREANACCPY